MARPSLDIGEIGNIGGIAFSTLAMFMGQGRMEISRWTVDPAAPMAPPESSYAASLSLPWGGWSSGARGAGGGVGVGDGTGQGWQRIAAEGRR
jgi:hypothetical protein